MKAVFAAFSLGVRLPASGTFAQGEKNKGADVPIAVTGTPGNYSKMSRTPSERFSSGLGRFAVAADAEWEIGIVPRPGNNSQSSADQDEKPKVRPGLRRA